MDLPQVDLLHEDPVVLRALATQVMSLLELSGTHLVGRGTQLLQLLCSQHIMQLDVAVLLIKPYLILGYGV
jgi:hypothetical protein